MKILVTGGTGFIGSHTVVELQEKGFEVVIADDLSNSFIEVVDNIEKITGVKPIFEKVDLSIAEETRKLFEKHKDIFGVIHFAASKAVGESVNKPLLYYRNNINSLINVLEQMQEHDIKNFVFSSSCTVYGQPDKLPVSENAPLKKALSPYGNTKKICEDIIDDVAAASEINAIKLRYFNPIGAHESALIGEYPQGIPNNLIPYLTQTAAGIREFLSIYGNDYNTPDGTGIRDYIHVVDLAKAHVIAIERMINNKCLSKTEIFNIGTGVGYSVLDIVKSFEKVNEIKINYKIVSRRAGDIEKVWADTAYANDELGWKAERTLDDMMRSAWNWETKLRIEN
ncbi:UDP-glucose 4-epimerase GalE [Bacteroidales bacterium OttesenSCG-928-K03]|nr:UDP-glucose 4-epimerase GalE [Odoribacter sp. OttesenSCG-928-L07]MDL2239111.1 UDP-glucose 4-epimerase GalE [Bacteroidales bacterium OttesenSCG-928-L14]MDL2240024.1 UDP-glucose 4-epimerase GalE [Bacteroidales bacterium OttesenSCG-928-K22]MDL2242264.1 UDP-glucose 4-epimerase GalE [Bacteroidales bacterium OttesenSCG-928-K03]